MATLVKTPSGTWKALIRKNGWPTVAKTFRTKRDAEDWSRRTEEEMVRGVYIRRSGSEKMTLEAALKRYLSDIPPTKKPTTQRGETSKAKKLIEHLGKYSMAALSAEIIAGYRDKRLNEPSRGGTISNNTVRLELALLSHLYTVAIQEWGLGLTFNPVLNIRKPSRGWSGPKIIAGGRTPSARGRKSTQQPYVGLDCLHCPGNGGFCPRAPRFRLFSVCEIALYLST